MDRVLSRWTTFIGCGMLELMLVIDMLQSDVSWNATLHPQFYRSDFIEAILQILVHRSFVHDRPEL
ncbi:hypothetical protein KSP40_PGU022586 [Platanthera guangdongensis]|uniref:Uncharacterized protein n=1 Tax=Platanthera guangdongensis TaxID=2320717 RepID=A0ABR2MW80_9ASPA